MMVHLRFWVELILSLPLLPIVWMQAKHVRRTVPRLPEASQGVQGRVGSGQKVVGLVTLGESTVVRIKHNKCPIVFANMPPVGQFPAFPRIMRMVLGRLIILHGLALRSLVKKQVNVHYVDQRIRFKDWAVRAGEKVSINDLFCDGVHPSPVAYALWGKEVGEYIVKRKLV